MTRAIQFLALSLLAASCQAGCSRDESTKAPASSTPDFPQTADAPVAAAKQGIDRIAKERSLQVGNEPLPARLTGVATTVGSRNETISSTNIPRTAELCVVEARKAVDLLEYEEALSLCNEALQISPDHVAALIERGQIWVWFSYLDRSALYSKYQDSKQLKVARENALSDFTHAGNVAIKGSSQEAIAAVPRSILRRILGHSFGDQELAEAIKLCNAVLAQHPDDVDCLLSRGEANFIQSKPGSFADVTRAIELDPGRLWSYRILFSHYMNSGAIEEAMKVANEIVRRFPNTPCGFKSQYFCLYQERKFDQALEAANKACAISKSPWNMREQAEALVHVGQLQKAIECQLEVVKVDPDTAKNYLGLSVMYGRAGNLRESIEAAKEYQSRVPDTNIAARKFVRRVEQIVAQSQLEKWNMKDGYDRYSTTTPEQVIASVQKQLKEKRPTTDLMIACGIEYYRIGQFEKAITLFDRAVGLNPQNAEAYGRRGVTFTRMQQQEKAHADLLKACRLNADTGIRR